MGIINDFEALFMKSVLWLKKENPPEFDELKRNPIFRGISFEAANARTAYNPGHNGETRSLLYAPAYNT